MFKFGQMMITEPPEASTSYSDSTCRIVAVVLEIIEVSAFAGLTVNSILNNNLS